VRETWDMYMGAICLLISSICYLLAGVDFYRKDKIGAAVAFIAYAIANVAFIYELIKKE